LEGKERLRCITNNLTRLRFRNSKGGIDFRYKGPIKKKPKNLTPWFDVPDRALASTRIVFGHWSALGYYNTGKLIGLDTGCVWGNKLTAIRLDSPDAKPIQIPSKQKKAF